MTDPPPDEDQPGEQRSSGPRGPRFRRDPAPTRSHEGSARSGFGRFLQRHGRPPGILQTVAGAAAIVAAGFVLSRVLGLLRTIVIADAFGTDPELAAYWVAFRLPDLVFQVLAGATLSAAFIPVFSRVLLRGESEAWRLASSVLNLVALATFVLAALAFALAPLIVPWLAPGLGVEIGREEELKSLAVDLTRFMLLSPLFFGISGMLTGILNARQHFIAPAVAPLIYNLSIIGGALFLAEPLGVYGLAWGVVVGSAGHLLVQLPALFAVGMRWSPVLDVFSRPVLDVMRLMGPRIIGLASTQVNFLALLFFASFISDEAISAIQYTFLIIMLPVGVIGMAISTAAFPTLARQGASGDYVQLRSSLTRALRVILLLSLPSSAGLILLAEPSVRLLLERGAFDAASTDLVVRALQVYAFGVFALCGVEILSRGFYALADTRTPVAVAVMAMAVNIVLAALLIAPFGLRGLAAAAASAAVIEFAVLIGLLHQRLGGFDTRALRRSLGSTAIGTGAMALVLSAVLLGLRALDVPSETTLGALVRVVVAGGLAGLAFLGVTYALNRDDYALATRGRLR